MEQKVVMWFSKGHKFLFLSCPLNPVCHVSKTVLQIKNYTTEVIMSCPSFLVNQTHLKETNS